MPPANALDASCNSRPAPVAPIPRVASIDELELRIVRHLARSRRQGDLIALLWIEIDLLTPHEPTPSVCSRDALAKAVGARLLHRVRRTDQVFQVGETGFAVLLDTDKMGARLVEQRMAAQLRGPYGMEGWMTHVHVSIGLSTAPEAVRQGSSLLQCAIDDMYVRRPVSSLASA